MPKKIEQLTKAQESRFQEFVDKWTSIGLSTEPANRERAENGIRTAYKIAGLQPPRIVWCGSPLSQGLTRAIVLGLKSPDVGNLVLDSVRASVRDSVGASVYGQHEAGWLSFYSYFLEVCNLACCKRLLPLMHMAEASGWWIPRKGIVLLSERPTYCNVNAAGRLHADGRMAIKYRDGFGVYANDGRRLPEKYGSVKTSDWQPKWLLEEKNAELRMTLIKAMGYDRIYQALEAKKIDSWREYELIKIDNADVEPIVLLKMVCPSTGKIHASRMPPHTKKARQAATMLNCGFDPETFIIEH